MSNSQAGKGDKYRPVNLKKWEENYDLAFRKRKTIEEWQKHFGHVIKSYDGFREYNHDDLLTQEEYERGYVRCTVLYRPPFGSKTLDNTELLEDVQA